MRKWLKRLFPGLVNSRRILLAIPRLIDFVDWWQRLEFAKGKMPTLAVLQDAAHHVVEFATSGLGNLCFTVVGLLIIFAAVWLRNAESNVHIHSAVESSRAAPVKSGLISKKPIYAARDKIIELQRRGQTMKSYLEVGARVPAPEKIEELRSEFIDALEHYMAPRSELNYLGGQSTKTSD